jgi:hypothetical protein
VLVIPDAAQLKRLATIVGLTQAIAVRPTVSDALREVAKAETHGFGH